MLLEIAVDIGYEGLSSLEDFEVFSGFSVPHIVALFVETSRSHAALLGGNEEIRS